MTTEHVDVIATTVSGSIKDWQKVERIVPLFADQGLTDVRLHVARSHHEARQIAREILRAGGRIPISAGGSGTFRHVLEGCLDSGVPLSEIRLGFLRKGSADLIGKVLGMPDRIQPAIAVFARAIRAGHTVPCDVLLAENTGDQTVGQHFVGYGGAEIFGRIPHFTENRFMKWYKGILGLFGDLGPFSAGMSLAVLERLLDGPFGGRGTWRINVDGAVVAEARYQALLIVNGYLGPDLPFAADPLGSGHFHLFALRSLGNWQLPRQVWLARKGDILKDPQRWGLESYRVENALEIGPSKPGPFPVNVDGSTMMCRQAVRVRIADHVRLIAGTEAQR